MNDNYNTIPKINVFNKWLLHTRIIKNMVQLFAFRASVKSGVTENPFLSYSLHYTQRFLLTKWHYKPWFTHISPCDSFNDDVYVQH